MNCLNCPLYSSCTALCNEAESYVNQDYIKQIDLLIGKVEMSSTCLINVTKNKEILIIEEYFFNRKKHKEIAEMIDVSRPYVTKTIKKYKAILRKNLEK